MKANSQPIEVKNLDHLGLVAGLVDDIGIVPIINKLLGEHQAEKIKAGQVVKAMILNGLGLVSSPLYLFSRFFEGKATEHLLGQGIQAEHLNDDRLGRVLDQLYQVGLNQVFMSIVLAVVEKYVIEVKTVHLDSSSFQVEGEYKSEESAKEEDFTTSKLSGYSYQAVNKTYAGIEQRWLVVQSQKRRESDLKKLEKEQQKERSKAEKQLRQFSRQKFACIPDARQAAKKLLKTSKFHQLTDIKIEPCLETASTHTTTVTYQVQATVSPCTEKIEPIRASAGRFIIATNVLDYQQLATEDMLPLYKGQQSVER